MRWIVSGLSIYSIVLTLLLVVAHQKDDCAINITSRAVGGTISGFSISGPGTAICIDRSHDLTVKDIVFVEN